MIETLSQMEEAGDHGALRSIWMLLGGETEMTGERPTNILIPLIQESCLPKGDIYAAERAAVADLAKTFDVDPSKYPTIETLENATVDAMAEKVEEKLASMSETERHKLAERLVRQLSEEQRLRVLDRMFGDLDKMEPEEREEFVRQLALELDVDIATLNAAIGGGASALLTLLVARQAGFSLFLLTTKVMFVGASSVGLTIPFIVFQMKNKALGWLLGPWGMLITTALSAGWFGLTTWRRRERFRKLTQLTAYCSAWRREASGNHVSSQT